MKYACCFSRRKKEGKEALSGRIQMSVLQVKEKYIAWAFSPTAFFRDLEGKSRISLNMKSFKLNTIIWYLVKEVNELWLLYSWYIFIWSTCNIPDYIQRKYYRCSKETAFHFVLLYVN